MPVVTTHTPSWLQLLSRPQARARHVAVRRAVRASIAYFDVHEMAVTGWEVYRWLWRGELSVQPSFAAVQTALRELTAEEVLKYREGMYCCAGRETLVEIRKQRQAIAARKWRKAQRMAALLAHVPYVRFVAVSNSLAWDNVREDSDIDFFLIAEQGRLWTARAWATVAIALLRRRPRLGHTRDTVCLNFWTAPGTPLRRVRLTEDVYFSYWLASLRPLYDCAGARRRLVEANRWLELSVPVAYGSRRRTDRLARLTRAGAVGKRLLELVQSVPGCERILERAQRAVMPRAILDKEIEPSSHVVLDGDMLKFHVNDRRAEVRDRWRRRLRLFEETTQ